MDMGEGWRGCAVDQHGWQRRAPGGGGLTVMRKAGGGASSHGQGRMQGSVFASSRWGAQSEAFQGENSWQAKQLTRDGNTG